MTGLPVRTLATLDRDCRTSIASIRRAIRHMDDRVEVTPGTDTLRRVWLHYGGETHLLLATDNVFKANRVAKLAEAVALGRAPALPAVGEGS